jgi:glucosamine-6-phosphate deaminase
MNKNLFDRVNINKANTRVPDGLAEDSAAHCAQYEACIEKVGGIDCQVLGIGANGHIGFNEPGSSLASRTRRVKLTPQTREDNARFFARLEDVPTEAITMGIGTVLECRRILLFASGPNKAKAVADALEGPVTVKAPASALQLHPDVTFILTQDSASQLTLDFARS